MVAIAHEREHKQYSRLYQFLKYQIWTGSCAVVTCPSAMTDGAARLLELQLQRVELESKAKEVFQRAHERLTSRDPAIAWTSGQWMTERPGGSDVQNTETQATCSADGMEDGVDIDGNPVGPYAISGFKWFSSATDANSTVLLAQEPFEGISAFFAPTRRRTSGPAGSELNGIQIQRLKNKLGTRALPTAELVIDGMRAWRIGKSGQGTKEISTVLNITRVHNAVSSVGSWGRGLAISRAFAKVRRARGKLLMNTPAHVRTLAEQQIEYRAMMHLTYYAVALLGRSENLAVAANVSSTCEPANVSNEAVPHLLRLLTPLAKMLTAKAAIAGLQECMESLGGVGYLENDDTSVNIARLYRDCNVLSIWEGTTNILADDLIRIVKGASGTMVLNAVDTLVKPTLSTWKARGRQEWAQGIATVWRELQLRIEKSSKDELANSGRVFANDLGWLVSAILLGEDALSDGDEASVHICARWISRIGMTSYMDSRSWTEQARSDRLIVFGAGHSTKL